MRGGLFSLRRMPTSSAESELEAERVSSPRDLTKLHLNDDARG